MDSWHFLAEGMITVSPCVSTHVPEMVHFWEREAIAFQVIDSPDDGDSVPGRFSRDLPRHCPPALPVGDPSRTESRPCHPQRPKISGVPHESRHPGWRPRHPADRRDRAKPKPMVEIGGRPILWHIMKHYAHYGFKEFVLAWATRARSSSSIF